MTILALAYLLVGVVLTVAANSTQHDTFSEAIGWTIGLLVSILVWPFLVLAGLITWVRRRA